MTRTNISIDADDDPYIDLTATENGVAVNFTGKIVELIIKANQWTADGSAIATLRSDGATPKITISTVTAVADLAGLVDTPGRYWFRARVYESGRKRTFARGWLTVEAA